MSSPRSPTMPSVRSRPPRTTPCSPWARAPTEFGIDKQVIELVKLRVSQINNCAFRLPLRAADPQRVAAVA